MKPLALDLFCCEGGVSTGLVEAGFDVVGVDVVDQPRYPYRFVRADALQIPLGEFDFVWASPPCQRYSRATVSNGKHRQLEHPDLVEPVRARLAASGLPWVIENVPGAPVRPDLILHGAMFGLPMHRERWFESNGLLLAPSNPRYARDGATLDGRFLMLAGKFKGAARAREVLGMPWASRHGLAQCIPPQYAAFIGRQVIAGLRMRAAA